MTDPKEAEAAWLAWYGGPPDYAMEHDGFIAGFRAARSAAPVAPTSAEPWTVTLYLVRQDKPDDEDHTLTCIFCGKSRGVEWEAGYRPAGRGELRGGGLCERCRVNLRAFVPREVAPSEPKPEAVAIPCPNCAPARHEAAQCLLCAGTGAIGKVKSEPEAVRPTDGELIATVRRGLEVADSSARVAFAELERRLNRG